MFHEATKEKGVRPLGDPVIDEVTDNEGEPFRFKASFEVMPEIEVKNYKGVEVRRLTATVTEPDVDQALEELRVRGADEKMGVKIIRRALEAPMRQIAANAGEEGAVIVDEVRSKSTDWGWDAQAFEIVDMMKAGIVDPAKVVRSALQNAASIASLMLTTETLITDLKDKDKAAVGAEI